MILDELTLHDFGVYGGRQSVTLTPLNRRPVVLFGGLNGGGKTTLLDALQLGFYGPLAQLSNRNGLAYPEYLRRSVHRGGQASGAAIEIAFRHTAVGEEQSYRLHRSWTTSRGGDIRERFEVIRNGRFDRLATEHWGAQVEEFLPARIAHLFLFDGEKVEAYADLQGAQALIATAIHNLLGLDIVERLTSDLTALERRHRVEHRSTEQRSGLEAMRAEIERLEATLAALVQERGSGANILDRLQRTAAELDEQFRREGGGLLEVRSAKEAGVAVAERQLDATRRALRDLASGAAPLLLVPGLLAAVAERDAGEEESRRSQDTLEALRTEHAALLALPILQGLDGSLRRDLQTTLEARLVDRASMAQAPRVLDLDAQARTLLSALRATELAELEPSLRAALATESDARAKVEEIRDEIAAIPSPDAIAGLVASRAEARLAVLAAEEEQTRRTAEIAAIEQQLVGLRQREERQLGDEIRARFDREDTVRMLRHSERVRSTLDRFRDAVVARHTSRIQALVLDSFRQLIRKEGLVTDLQIDPQTFAISLRDGAGHAISGERLSAGERQLLAIALLWGLARAAGRPLPTVIDTPLGRLDAQHRDHLVRRYFPNASHQVILLSTDEEITGRHLAALRPSIGREYRLRFDEAERRTVIEPGYFGGQEMLAHAG